MKIYVDTNVFISYWFSDFGKIEDFQEYYAENLINKTIKCQFTIVIYGLTLSEMSSVSKLDEREIKNSWLKPLINCKKIEIIEANNKDILIAKKLVKDKRIKHIADAVHAALALKYNLPIITWNIKDFKKMKNMCIKTPKEL